MLDEDWWQFKILFKSFAQVVRAHKLILSACSPWFQKVWVAFHVLVLIPMSLMFSILSQVILSLPVGPEAVIAIWDCPLPIITALLAFMYQGKVQVTWNIFIRHFVMIWLFQVPQEDLPTFLKVAERLQVKLFKPLKSHLCHPGSQFETGERSDWKSGTEPREPSKWTR